MDSSRQISRESCAPCAGHTLNVRRLALVVLLAVAASSSAPNLNAGPIRDWMQSCREERNEARAKQRVEEALPQGVGVERDLAYGPHAKQRLDVYRSTRAPAASAEPAPVIVMVHGGAWKLGDKGAENVVTHKVTRWVPAGFVFVSVNYRLLPEADPLAQADDVARAIAFVQQHAPEWGADPVRVILMGHSAGAHLVALISSRPKLALQHGAKPWLGSVLLDSAALDVPAILERSHFRFYDEAFGRDPEFWKRASPYHQLATPVAPMLAVYSSRRDDSSAQAKQFAARAATLDTKVTLHAEDLTHEEINDRLGRAGTYTEAVERFLRDLDPVVAARLRATPLSAPTSGP